ncbi:hypothetical protein [Amycolatopsis sp. lyj-109]|uniref:hypothetical protein n=1 Tax=Amycolatopsis sp. lyj-109 TaxID=2789287 RepID=UPI00397912E5
MPTAIEYAVAAPWHGQNGCGGGPPAQNFHGGGASLAGSVVHPDVVPAPAEGLLLTGLPVALLVAAVVWRRRRGGGTPAG